MSVYDKLPSLLKQACNLFNDRHEKDILRNTFENESVTIYRKTEKEYSEIENIKLSLAVSGTPNQFKRLMGSTENGLFGRGCYYVFDNPSSKLVCFGRMNNEAKLDLDSLFADFADIADGYYKLHLGLDTINVVFNGNQLEEVQTALQSEFNRISNFGELSSNIKRSFSIALKVGTILTFLGACESGRIDEKIECSKVALELAIDFMKTNLNHGYKAFELLPKKEKARLSVNQERLYFELSPEFTRQDAKVFANKLGIAERTMDDYLKVFKDKGVIEVTGKGSYKKVG